MELIIKGILFVDIHNLEILSVEITLTIHPPHHPATHTDTHPHGHPHGPGGWRPTEKMPQGTNKKDHEEQKELDTNKRIESVEDIHKGILVMEINKKEIHIVDIKNKEIFMCGAHH